MYPPTKGIFQNKHRTKTWGFVWGYDLYNWSVVLNQLSILYWPHRRPSSIEGLLLWRKMLHFNGNKKYINKAKITQQGNIPKKQTTKTYEMEKTNKKEIAPECFALYSFCFFSFGDSEIGNLHSSQEQTKRKPIATECFAYSCFVSVS